MEKLDHDPVTIANRQAETLVTDGAANQVDVHAGQWRPASRRNRLAIPSLATMSSDEKEGKWVLELDDYRLMWGLENFKYFRNSEIY